MTRDCAPPAVGQGADATVAAGEGRNCIAVIGIDGYQSGWPHLRNAVNDATGVLKMFEGLGFQRAVEPLLNDAATRDALNYLVSDQLRSLRENDNLIVFFAGHGHTAASVRSRRSYLIPVDAGHSDGDRSTWILLEHWLEYLADLLPRHILIFLDSCHSGIALDSDIHGRSYDPVPECPGSPLISRYSRRVITSAYDHERAADSGPVLGHSLFTGCLIKAIQGGLAKHIRQPVAMGDELFVYLRREVSQQSNQRQTPRTGKLGSDDGGEFAVPLVMRSRKRRSPSLLVPDPQLRRPELAAQEQRHPTEQRAPAALAAHVEVEVNTRLLCATTHVPEVVEAASEHVRRQERTESWTLDPAFVAALDRHGAERARGFHVLSVIGGEAMAAQTAWATWAARRGYLTLISEGADLTSTITDLLIQTPWLRCLAEARTRLAAAARIEVDAVDAALDARSRSERRRWIDDIAALDHHVLVSGWLLSTLRESKARVPDLTAAPAQGAELLGIACDLAAPTAVLLRHPAPTAAWLEQAIGTAVALIPRLRHHSVAVTAPDALLTSVLHGTRDSRVLTMARQGRIALTKPARRAPGRGRSRTTRVLHAALAVEPRTRGQFELNAQVALPETGQRIDVDLLAPRARIAVELDGWHHFQDPEGYRRDRDQDMRLQRAGYFVMRFLTEDVDDRMASTLDQIAIALAGRRASGALT